MIQDIRAVVVLVERLIQLVDDAILSAFIAFIVLYDAIKKCPNLPFL